MRQRDLLVTVVLVTLLSGACSGARDARTAHARASRLPHPAPAIAAPAHPLGVRRLVFGHSVQGRALTALLWGPATAARRLLVVGVIHGDEPAGLAISLAALRLHGGADAALLVVPDLNPDGVAAGTRQNAHHVDLNRNFPYRWAAIGRPGDQQYAGPGPLSEPETRAMAQLIRSFRPTVSVWFHQPIGVVDESGGAVSVERRFADLVGLPLRRLRRYHGSAPSWENTIFRGGTAFVVELPRRVSSVVRQRVLVALKDLLR